MPFNDTEKQHKLEIPARTTGNGLRPNNFDLIRLLAALQVVTHHGIEHLGLDSVANHWLVEVLKCFPGVPIFFVLSGFLVSASLERSKSLPQYALNRALRIFPGLWCCFAFSVIIVLLLNPELFQQASIKEVFPWVLAQLTMFQFYNPDFLRPFGLGALNGSLWTIPVELQFYFVLPAVYAIFRKGKSSTWMWLVAGIISGLAINQTFKIGFAAYRDTIWYKLFACSMLPYIWLFLLGVYPSTKLRNNQTLLRRKTDPLVGRTCIDDSLRLVNWTTDWFQLPFSWSGIDSGWSDSRVRIYGTKFGYKAIAAK